MIQALPVCPPLVPDTRDDASQPAAIKFLEVLMKKALVLILCLSFFVGFTVCSKSLLPDNAAQFIEKFEALGKQAVDKSNPQAIEAQKAKIGELVEEGKKLSESLPEPVRKIFMEQVNKIAEQVKVQ